jgi:hypothetical protein
MWLDCRLLMLTWIEWIKSLQIFYMVPGFEQEEEDKNGVAQVPDGVMELASGTTNGSQGVER